MRVKFASEAELAQHAKAWLATDGWDVYCEVAPWGNGAPRADMVGVRGKLLCVVETKMTLGLSLLEQCAGWVGHAHQVWAAVPKARSNRGTWTRNLFESYGVGILQVSSWGADDLGRPRFNRSVSTVLRDALHESQRESIAGSNRGGYSTPFTRTCEELLRRVTKLGGRVLVKDALKAFDHHYSNDACARSSLVARCDQGVVPGLRIAREGRALYFEKIP